MEKRYFLGFDIGGTKLGIGLGTEDGTLLGQERIPNRNTRPEEILPVMVAASKKLIAEAHLTSKDICAFGISTPSPADIPNGIITHPTNNPYWRNVPLRSYLEQELGIRGFFENDANCAALAEWYFGAGKGASDMIYLTMSTGIGAGIIADRRLIRGCGYSAGEFGHAVLVPDGRPCNCGLRGCYEAYAGGLALAQRMREELKDQPDHPMFDFVEDRKLENLEMIALERAARAGVDYAVKLWDEMCLRNAQAYGMLINTFNPEKIVLGTIAYAAGDFFMEPVRRYLPRFAWPEPLAQCELVPSLLKRDIATWAGIAGARYALELEKTCPQL